MARSIPPDEAGAAKYFLAIDARMLSFTPRDAGIRELGISVAACTFDKTGQPLQYLQKNSLAKLNEEQFTVASRGITQTFQFSPKPGVARVRLLVRDSASGRIGSVDVPYEEPTKPAPTLMSEPPAPETVICSVINSFWIIATAYRLFQSLTGILRLEAI